MAGKATKRARRALRPNFLLKIAAKSTTLKYAAVGKSMIGPKKGVKASVTMVVSTITGGTKYRRLAFLGLDLVRTARQAPVSKNCLIRALRLDLGR